MRGKKLNMLWHMECADTMRNGRYGSYSRSYLPKKHLECSARFR